MNKPMGCKQRLIFLLSEIVVDEMTVVPLFLVIVKYYSLTIVL